MPHGAWVLRQRSACRGWCRKTSSLPSGRLARRSASPAIARTRRKLKRAAWRAPVLVEIPPFDHPDVIAGQGTIGLELLEDFPEIDTAVVPLSGGGLIGGIALALKSASAKIRVIGVSMRRGAAMHASLVAGKPIEIAEESTLADSLGGGIGLANQFTLSLVRDLVDDVVLVSEPEIAAAMRTLFLTEGLVAEGAGAIGLALLKEPHLARLGRYVAIVISGRNVDMALFRRVIDGEVPV